MTKCTQMFKIKHNMHLYQTVSEMYMVSHVTAHTFLSVIACVCTIDVLAAHGCLCAHVQFARVLFPISSVKDFATYMLHQDHTLHMLQGIYTWVLLLFAHMSTVLHRQCCSQPVVFAKCSAAYAMVGHSAVTSCIPACNCTPHDMFVCAQTCVCACS